MLHVTSCAVKGGVLTTSNSSLLRRNNFLLIIYQKHSGTEIRTWTVKENPKRYVACDDTAGHCQNSNRSVLYLRVSFRILSWPYYLCQDIDIPLPHLENFSHGYLLYLVREWQACSLFIDHHRSCRHEVGLVLDCRNFYLFDVFNLQSYNNKDRIQEGLIIV